MHLAGRPAGETVEVIVDAIGPTSVRLRIVAAGAVKVLRSEEIADRKA